MFYGLIIAAVLLLVYGPHLWAGHVMNRYNRTEYFSGNGMDLARLILDRLNMTDVTVKETQSGDHYDPESKTVNLTRERCGRKSLTAVVVAAHEVGHAVQDRTGYPPLRTRTRMVAAAAKFERIGAAILIAVPIFAVVTRVPAAGLLLLVGGLATLCVPLLIHLLTLPTEFDASFQRALPMLASGNYIPEEDIPAARKILTACALTYVAGALVGLVNVWRWIRILRR